MARTLGNQPGRGLNPLPIILGTMLEEQEKKERTRRTYAKRGSRNQIMMSFRLDNELIEWVYAQHNRGRYINELIREDMKHALNI